MTDASIQMQSEKPEDQGIVAKTIQDVWDSIFIAGVNQGTIWVMNLSFVFLFLSLILLAIVTSANWHVIALLVIALCLFGSIQWFVIEIAKIQANEGTEAKSGIKSSYNSKVSGQQKPLRQRTRKAA